MKSDDELRKSITGSILERFYLRLPGRTRLLAFVTEREGGQMQSATLRAILRRYHGVSAGAHAYGSLLTPGMCDRGTQIGRYTSIGPNVRRFGAAHPLTSPSLHPYWYNASFGLVTNDQDVKRTPLTIGPDCWIGANVTILPGCSSIGVGAVIGAGSVVTRDVESFAIMAGNPARRIGERFEDSCREQILASKYWELPPTQARSILDEIAHRWGIRP